MTRGSPGEQKSGIIHETVAKPLRSSSVFYALYYLSEVKGVDAASYDLHRVTSVLNEGFYWYGIYSMARELGNMDLHFFIDGEHNQRATRKEREAAILGEVDFEALDKCLDIMSREYRKGINPTPGRKTIADTFDNLEQEVNIISDPEDFTFAAKELFNVYTIIPELGTPPEAHMTVEGGYTGWEAFFGGEGWNSIAEHLMSRDDLPSRLWVDMCFSIEHNSGTWMDKANPLESEKDAYNESELWKMDDAHEKLTNESTYVTYAIMRDQLLDNNHEGNMEPIYKMALQYNSDLDINLRRYRNHFN